MKLFIINTFEIRQKRILYACTNSLFAVVLGKNYLEAFIIMSLGLYKKKYIRSSVSKPLSGNVYHLKLALGDL